MADAFAASRVARLLRVPAALLGLFRRNAAKFGAMPLLYANAARDTPPPAAGPASDTLPPLGSAADADTLLLLDKRRLNSQIPLKPVYIAPRNPVVLCHGLYGFDVKGPEKLPMLQVHYWRGIREALEGVGAKVVTARVPGTGGVRERAHQLDALLTARLGAARANIIGHSMGGLDARYLITHISPKQYSVASLTTVCTPHRGSPFMDWCRDYLSLGYRVDPDQLIRDFSAIWRSSATATNPMANAAAAPEMPEEVLRARIRAIIRRAVSSDCDVDPSNDKLRDFARFLTRLLGENASLRETLQLDSLARTSAIKNDYLDRSAALLRMVYRRIMATLDTPAYACLTTDYCQRFFNPSTPNVPGVDYLSIGAHMDPTDISDKINPLIIPHDIIHRAEGPNDGFVSLTSAQWGHYLGSVCADHFEFTNRWRLTAMGRDFIGTVMYWSGKWSSWLSHSNASAAAKDPLAGAPRASSRFDPIDFYLRLGTILYTRGL